MNLRRADRFFLKKPRFLALSLAVIAALLSLAPSSVASPLSFDAAELEPYVSNFFLVVTGASTAEPYMVAGHLVLRAQQGDDDVAFDWGVFNPSRLNFVF